MLGFRHRIKRAAEFDDVPVAVVPIVQQRKIVPDFVDRHRVPRSIPAPYIGLRAAESDTVKRKWRWFRAAQGRAAPLRHHIVRRQRVARRCRRQRASASSAPPIEPVWSGGLLVGDDVIELARAVLGALADRGGGLAADFAGGRLALAKLAHVRHRRGGGRDGFRRPDLAEACPIQASSLWAAARAPARARMPCEAEKTSRDPGRLLWFGCDLQPLRLSSRNLSLD